MKHSSRLLGILAGGLVMAFAFSAIADDDAATITARLVGYQEAPLTINSAGSAEFRARISHDQTSIDYELTYRDLSSTVTQSHIHFGRPAIAGQIVLFLCTNLGNGPAGVPVQACPPAPATITGTLTAADVIARPTQGIDGGAAGFAEIVKAIRAGAAYVNVHTTTFTGGEIRSVLNVRKEDDDHDH